MSYYFDISNGMVAVIETDTPEPGWIKLTSKQSRLAARYRIEDGNVVDAYPGKTDEEVLAAIQAEHEAQAESSLTPQKVISKLAFMNRLTMEELAAIYTAAKSDVLVEVFMDKLKLAENIDLADPQTIAGVQALVSKGLLTEARAQEVLK